MSLKFSDCRAWGIVLLEPTDLFLTDLCLSSWSEAGPACFSIIGRESLAPELLEFGRDVCFQDVSREERNERAASLDLMLLLRKHFLLE